MMTKVGTFDLDEFAIRAMWSRQDLPEPQMETGGVGVSNIQGTWQKGERERKETYPG